MTSGKELFSRFFPLTVLGAPFALALFGLLGNAFATANPYAYLLSLSGLGLLLILAVATRLQAGNIDEDQLKWRSSHRVFAGKGPAPHTLEVESCTLLPFLRIRYTLYGLNRAGNTRLGVHFRTGRFRPEAGKEQPLPVSIPRCGAFHANLVLSVEDIFGLTRARIGTRQTRLIPVLPGVLNRPVRYHIAERGAEEKNRMKESEVERYYMREYVPGDRFRDINWKSSSRGDKLYTRISPVAQEETTTITLCTRFYARDIAPSPKSLALAEYQKSWIITFLLKIEEEHPSFRFQVFLNNEEFLLENDEDLERFAIRLGDAWFSEPTTLIPGLPQEGQVYLFTTAGDETVEALRLAFPKTEFKQHLTRIAGRPERRSGESVPWELFPLYEGEDLPSAELAAGLFRRMPRLERRLPGTIEDVPLAPRLAGGTKEQVTRNGGGPQ